MACARLPGSRVPEFVYPFLETLDRLVPYLMV
jgi:hypothetical protein